MNTYCVDGKFIVEVASLECSSFFELFSKCMCVPFMKSTAAGKDGFFFEFQGLTIFEFQSLTSQDG